MPVFPPRFLAPSMKEEVKTVRVEKEIGSYIEINYKKAVALTKGEYSLFSNGRGNYLFQKDYPSDLTFKKINSPTAGVIFKLNKIAEKLKFFVNGEPKGQAIKV